MKGAESSNLESSLVVVWDVFESTSVFDCLESSLSVILGEHVFRSFTFAMTAIAHDGHLHHLVFLISRSEDMFEIVRKSMEFVGRQHPWLNNSWLYLYCFSVVSKRRTIEVSFMMFRGHGRTCKVIVMPIKLLEWASSCKESLTISSFLLFIVHGHHVL